MVESAANAGDAETVSGAHDVDCNCAAIVVPENRGV
jgi:hypothetical protein